MDEYEWGDASVSFPDWIGTAQLDQKVTGTVDVYTLTGIDPDGLDLACGDATLRLAFPERVTTAQQLRKVVVDLATNARAV